MNRRLAELAAFCREHPLEEKILVCPGYSIGTQIAESLVRHGHSYVNLRTETVYGLASGLVAAELATENMAFLASIAQLLFVEQAIGQSTGLLLEKGSYFGPLRDVPGFAPSLLRAINDLRAAGIEPADLLAQGALVSERKARELKQVYEACLHLLAKNRRFDGADLLQRAVRFLADGKPHPFQQALFLVLSDQPLTSLQCDLLVRLARGRAFLVRNDPVAGFGPLPDTADVLLSGLAEPIEARDCARTPMSDLFSLDEKPRQGPGLQVVVRRALGESNEVREVFRSILDQGIAADQVEVTHSDTETYVPLLLEASERLGVPCTFAEGVPVHLTRPGRALLGFLNWVEKGFEEAELRRLFASGALDLRSLERDGGYLKAPGHVRAARHLRNAQIGWGRERYGPQLEALCQSYRAKAAERDEEGIAEAESVAGTSPTGSVTAGRTVSPKEKLLDQSLAETRCLLAFLREALSFVPESPGNLCLSELYGGARRFVEQFARQACERDALAANALSVALEEVEQLQRTGASLERAAQRLREMVVSLRIGTSGPKPGHVHVSHYGTGGYSGRPHLFVLGLDERRFPGIGIQEPVLLDHERMAINRGFGKHLSLAEDRPTANLVRLTACLAAHRGPMVLSYSCRDLLDNREVCPSSVILQAHRLITGRHDDDYSALDKALPPPHGFVVTEGLRLTESERWIAQIKAVKGGTDARSAVDKAFPWLKTGALAEAKRASAEFTEFDGYIPAACDGLDFRRNGKAVSPSALEDLAKCPFGYFLKRVLGVEPPEELERTPDVWLDPLQFGSLLHAVFEGFMRQLTELAEKPEFRKHRKALGTIAERKIHEFLQLYPSPGEAAFARTRRDIELALDTFLSSQERFCQDSVPCHFEVPFGLEEADTAKEPLATVDPVSLPVGKDKLAVRGIIDRIDRTTPHEYQVWDYKTGSASKYSRSKGLDSGRVLQFALYARVAERLLRQRDPDAKVTESGYLFPGPRGEGERIAHPRSSLSELEEVLGHILDMLRNGVMAHPPTGVCDYCDYQSVCGEPETAIERMAAKMDAAGEESPLKPYRSLYGSKTTKTGQK